MGYKIDMVHNNGRAGDVLARRCYVFCGLLNPETVQSNGQCGARNQAPCPSNGKDGAARGQAPQGALYADVHPCTTSTHGK